MIATATNVEGGMFFQDDNREKGKNSSGIETIRSFIQLAAQKKINGVLCTAWDDKSPHMENYWRGFIASAEYCWSPNGRTLAEYDTAWLQREFGLSMPDYQSFNNQLRKGSVLWFEAFYRNGNCFSEGNELQSMAQLEHWLKPTAGMEKRQFDYTTKLIELPDLNAPGSWSIKYKDRLERSIIEINNNKVLLEKLIELQNTSKRNWFFWALSKALYNLQSTVPHILLALKQSDSANNIQQKVGIKNVNNVVKEFHLRWADLQAVYCQTICISYQVSYVPDRYFHNASQRDDLSWMI